MEDEEGVFEISLYRLSFKHSAEGSETSINPHITEAEQLLGFCGLCFRWHPTPVLLPGKSQGWRSLVCALSWIINYKYAIARHKLDSTYIYIDYSEQLHFHFSLSCIGQGNGNPLQCSCLENPRDGGAWWAAVYGVARCRT